MDQQRVFAGQRVTGHVVLTLFDVYKSGGGLDKCTVRLHGLEMMRYCEQKHDQPKKNRNRKLIVRT